MKLDPINEAIPEEVSPAAKSSTYAPHAFDVFSDADLDNLYSSIIRDPRIVHKYSPSSIKSQRALWKLIGKPEEISDDLFREVFGEHMQTYIRKKLPSVDAPSATILANSLVDACSESISKIANMNEDAFTETAKGIVKQLQKEAKGSVGKSDISRALLDTAKRMFPKTAKDASGKRYASIQNPINKPIYDAYGRAYKGFGMEQVAGVATFTVGATIGALASAPAVGGLINEFVPAARPGMLTQALGGATFTVAQTAALKPTDRSYVENRVDGMNAFNSMIRAVRKHKKSFLLAATLGLVAEFGGSFMAQWGRETYRQDTMHRISDIQWGLGAVKTDVHTILYQKVASADKNIKDAISREKADRKGEGPMSEFTERIFNGGSGSLTKGTVPEFRTALQSELRTFEQKMHTMAIPASVRGAYNANDSDWYKNPTVPLDQKLTAIQSMIEKTTEKDLSKLLEKMRKDVETPLTYSGYEIFSPTGDDTHPYSSRAEEEGAMAEIRSTMESSLDKIADMQRFAQDLIALYTSAIANAEKLAQKYGGETYTRTPLPPVALDPIAINTNAITEPMDAKLPDVGGKWYPAVWSELKNAGLLGTALKFSSLRFLVIFTTIFLLTLGYSEGIVRREKKRTDILADFIQQMDGYMKWLVDKVNTAFTAAYGPILKKEWANMDAPNTLSDEAMEHLVITILALYEPGLKEFIGEKLSFGEYVKQTATTSVHIPDVRKYRLLYLALEKMSEDNNLTERLTQHIQEYLLRDGSTHAQWNNTTKTLSEIDAKARELAESKKLAELARKEELVKKPKKQKLPVGQRLMQGLMDAGKTIRDTLDNRKLQKQQKAEAKRILALITQAGYQNIKSLPDFAGILSGELAKLQKTDAMQALVDDLVSVDSSTGKKTLRVNPPEWVEKDAFENLAFQLTAVAEKYIVALNNIRESIDTIIWLIKSPWDENLVQNMQIHMENMVRCKNELAKVETEGKKAIEQLQRLKEASTPLVISPVIIPHFGETITWSSFEETIRWSSFDYTISGDTTTVMGLSDGGKDFMQDWVSVDSNRYYTTLVVLDGVSQWTPWETERLVAEIGVELRQYSLDALVRKPDSLLTNGSFDRNVATTVGKVLIMDKDVYIEKIGDIGVVIFNNWVVTYQNIGGWYIPEDWFESDDIVDIDVPWEAQDIFQKLRSVFGGQIRESHGPMKKKDFMKTYGHATKQLQPLKLENAREDLEYITRKLNDGDMVLVATDGVFDNMSVSHIWDIIRESSVADSAKEIMRRLDSMQVSKDGDFWAYKSDNIWFALYRHNDFVPDFSPEAFESILSEPVNQDFTAPPSSPTLVELDTSMKNRDEILKDLMNILSAEGGWTANTRTLVSSEFAKPFQAVGKTIDTYTQTIASYLHEVGWYAGKAVLRDMERFALWPVFGITETMPITKAIEELQFITLIYAAQADVFTVAVNAIDKQVRDQQPEIFWEDFFQSTVDAISSIYTTLDQLQKSHDQFRAYIANNNGNTGTQDTVL